MISSSQRPLPDNTQQSQQTEIHVPGRIRTLNLSSRAALDRAATGTGFCLIVAFLILSLVQIRTERRQNSIYGEFSFATVFASKDHVLLHM